jgi:predicted RNA-binding Zn-ribbon protein involved in translation (DUF1610 family)
MNVTYIMNCERCGQPLKVTEFEHNYVVMVGENIVQECPMCGEAFNLRPSTDGADVVQAMRDLLKGAEDG